MNGHEQVTLEKLDKKLTKHMERVEPFLKAHYDKKVIDTFVSKVWRGIVAVLGVLALIGGLWALLSKD